MAIVGRQRTDTGVNARRMGVPISMLRRLPTAGKFLLSLNRLCGPAVALEDLIRVPDDAHARFDATEREYRYFVSFGKSLSSPPYPGILLPALDTEAMNQGGSFAQGRPKTSHRSQNCIPMRDQYL